MSTVVRVTDQRQVIGIALVLVSTLAFAIGPTSSKLALDNGSNTLTVVTLRGVIGAALMAPLIALSGRGFRLGRRALAACVWCGGFYAVMVYAFIASIGLIPVNVAVLIFFTHPILIAALAHWRGGDRLTARKAALALVALGGLALVLAPELGDLDPAGVALAALAAVSMCGMVGATARAQAYATSTQVNFYVTAVTGVAFVALTTGAAAWAQPVNALGWLGIAGAGVGIGLGLLTFFAALAYLSPVRATMLSTIEPLVSILVAAAVLGEQLTPLRWLGVALVIGALTLFEAAGHQRRAA
jgi:drug/metabolite transporter (DMT)-like permease